MYNVARGRQVAIQRNLPVRQIFEATQIEQYGIWIELVPHRVKMIYTDPGSGVTPSTGQFIWVKQILYKDDMTQLRGQRITYLYGRGVLLPGLQMCLSLCREGTKARCYIASEFAYGKQKIEGIPLSSSLVIDIEIISITSSPQVRDTFQDELFIKQISALAAEGDRLMDSGSTVMAQLKYETAFQNIQSSRGKDIKHYLYSSTRSSYIGRQGKLQLEAMKVIENDKQNLNKLLKTFDNIKVKTVDAALVNKDYYKIILLTKECVLEGRLNLNDRVIFARAKALVEVGEFQLGIGLLKSLSEKSEGQEHLRMKEELQRAILRRQKAREKIKQQLMTQPVVSFTKHPTRVFKGLKKGQGKAESTDI